MLSTHEIESMRRSHAMAPLAAAHVTELIDTCAQLAKERAVIATVLADLPDSFRAVRDALNTLQRLVS